MNEKKKLAMVTNKNLNILNIILCNIIKLKKNNKTFKIPI